MSVWQLFDRENAPSSEVLTGAWHRWRVGHAAAESAMGSLLAEFGPDVTGQPAPEITPLPDNVVPLDEARIQHVAGGAVQRAALEEQMESRHLADLIERAKREAA